VAPDIARDKDGVSAIIAVLELAAGLKAEGRTLVDRLDEIYREHGLHSTTQLSVRVEDLEIIRRAMDTLRTTPPTTLGGQAVTAVDDLADGYHGLPPTDGIRLQLDGDARIICRPSGTEPKLKCYLEIVVPVDDSIDVARTKADAALAEIKRDLGRPGGTRSRPR